MNSPAAQASPVPAKLNDLIAINREVAAMVRAGIPLEMGLRTVAGGLSNRLSRLADRIADRLGQGQSLPDAIELEASRESPVYAAVISAGLQSGQLPDALESVASSAELIRDTRSHVARAMVYPAVVIVLAYLLFAAIVWYVSPRYVETAEAFGFAHLRVFEIMTQIRDAEPIWFWLVPLIGLATAVILRFCFRSSALNPFFLARLLGRAQFAELLKIQLAHGLPIGPAFRRAAAGSGDSSLRRAAESVCSNVENGVPFSKAISDSRGLPPLMTWMLATGASQGTLPASLTLIADSCRRQAARRAYYLKVWLPVLVTFVVGGSVVLIYGLMNFIPLVTFWDGLMLE